MGYRFELWRALATAQCDVAVPPPLPVVDVDVVAEELVEVDDGGDDGGLFDDGGFGEPDVGGGTGPPSCGTDAIGIGAEPAEGTTATVR